MAFQADGEDVLMWSSDFCDDVSCEFLSPFANFLMNPSSAWCFYNSRTIPT